MAGRPKAGATRAASRAKGANGSMPVTTTARTTRATVKADLDNSEQYNHKNVSRKPLLNRANSPDTKPADRIGKPSVNPSATKHTIKLNSPQDAEGDLDREPVKVSFS